MRVRESRSERARARERARESGANSGECAAKMEALWPVIVSKDILLFSDFRSNLTTLCFKVVTGG